MSESSLSGGLDRFSKRKDVEKTLADIADSTAGLNESLSYSSDEYDSLVVFSHVPGESAAVPVSTTDAYDSTHDRHRFRDDAVTNRRVVLRGTSLGLALADETNAGYAASQINHSVPQMVYTERLVHEGSVVGAIQHSFTPTFGRKHIENLPISTEIEALTQQNRKEVAQVAARVALLQSLGKDHGPLGLSLEYEDPIAPNSFIVRWDIEDSRNLARSSRMPALDAFENQTHLFLRGLTETYKKRYLVDEYGIDKIYDDQGDGAYLVLPLPTSYNPYDPRVLADYYRYSAAPFIETVHHGLATIGANYLSDLAPRVQVSGEFGYFEKNGIGRLKSSTMYSLSAQKKK